MSAEMRIAAKPTLYGGIVFRSRMEARVARWMDEEGREWKYEPGSYPMPSGAWYMPDFYVRGWGWVEVKPTCERLEKWHEFAGWVDQPVWLLTPTGMVRTGADEFWWLGMGNVDEHVKIERVWIPWW